MKRNGEGFYIDGGNLRTLLTRVGTNIQLSCFDVEEAVDSPPIVVLLETWCSRGEGTKKKNQKMIGSIHCLYA